VGDYKLRSIDLTTLTHLPDLPVAIQPARIREGLNGRLYVSDFTGKVWAIDSASGTTLGGVIASYPITPALAISLDRTVLFVGAQRGSPATITKYDVSGTPVRILPVANAGDYGWGLTLSNTGKYICFATNPSSSPVGTTEFSAADLTKNFGTLVIDTPMSIAFSPDDSMVYQTSLRDSYVGVYDTASCQLLRKIELGKNSSALNVAVDSSGAYVFVVGYPTYGSTWVRVYPVKALPGPVAPPHSLLNISTRLQAQGGDDALIGGFIVTGQASKKLALRAIGPSLPVPGKLADPILQLYDSSGALVAENDNWNSHRSDVIATGIPPLDEREAVVVTTVEAGNYTAVVKGLNDASGVGLVEAYDLNPDSASRLANISTRGKVELGDNVMIGGFILGGDQLTRVVVRAIGPSLVNFGVADPLADPSLEVHDGNGALLAEDDDWRNYQEQMLIDTGLAPTDDRESAMLLVLPPGAYTAIVRGKGNAVGIGLVEVYNLDAN
jgi:DNA-binding beta-propeller fold protein YncE